MGYYTGMKRKTIEIQFVRDYYETLTTLPNMEDSLEGATKVLEATLFQTKQYEGFAYIDNTGKVCGLDHPDFHEYRRRYN